MARDHNSAKEKDDSVEQQLIKVKQQNIQIYIWVLLGKYSHELVTICDRLPSKTPTKHYIINFFVLSKNSIGPIKIRLHIWREQNKRLPLNSLRNKSLFFFALVLNEVYVFVKKKNYTGLLLISIFSLVISAWIWIFSLGLFSVLFVCFFSEKIFLFLLLFFGNKNRIICCYHFNKLYFQFCCLILFHIA